jgi:hypothetical protein
VQVRRLLAVVLGHCRPVRLLQFVAALSYAGLSANVSDPHRFNLPAWSSDDGLASVKSG